MCLGDPDCGGTCPLHPPRVNPPLATRTWEVLKAITRCVGLSDMVTRLAETETRVESASCFKFDEYVQQHFLFT